MSKPNKTYGVFDLLCDIRDAHTICNGEPTAKAILWAIASRTAANKGFTCFPSLERLANDTQLSERNIRKHMETLLAEGLIQRKRRYDTSYIYTVAVEKIKAVAIEQRKEWSLHRKIDDLGADAFDDLISQNWALASAVTDDSAADASFPEPSSSESKALDYTSAVTSWIGGSLGEKLDAEEAHELATGICRDNLGSAPVIALLQLEDATIAKACAAKTPAAYLRSVIRKNVGRLSEKEFPALKDKEIAKAVNGKDGFSVPSSWGSARIDHLIGLVLETGATLGHPYIEDKKVVFPRKRATEFGEEGYGSEDDF